MFFFLILPEQMSSFSFSLNLTKKVYIGPRTPKEERFSFIWNSISCYIISPNSFFFIKILKILFNKKFNRLAERRKQNKVYQELYLRVWTGLPRVPCNLWIVGPCKTTLNFRTCEDVQLLLFIVMKYGLIIEGLKPELVNC